MERAHAYGYDLPELKSVVMDIINSRQLQRHHATFFACFLTFAHHFFAAFAIAALPAADSTRTLPIYEGVRAQPATDRRNPEGRLRDGPCKAPGMNGKPRVKDAPQKATK